MTTTTANWPALAARAQRIADLAVISDIETNGLPEIRAGLTWYDMRQALSPDEHCPEVIDMMLEALEYARFRGLIVQHAFDRHLVRLCTNTLTRAAA